MTTPQSNQIFMNFYKFDQSDLVNNKQGVISEKQKQKVIYDAAKRLLGHIGIIFALLGLVLAGMFIKQYHSLSDISVNFYLIGLLLIFLVFLNFLRIAYQSSFGSVKSVEGPAKITKSIQKHNGNVTRITYIIEVEKVRFEEDENVFEVGEKYRIFFLSGTRIILSVEVLN